MSYDEGLHTRVEEVLNSRIGYKNKIMFGGIGYLLNGNMLGGIINEDLIIRAGKNKHDELLEMDHTKVFDITGRIMQGWIMVKPEGLESDEKLLF